MERVYFVSGIDTDAGKSYATGILAARWREQGVKVITQKFIQTGCGSGKSMAVSEDIALHRRLMGLELLPEDLDGTTCPIMFSYPASPDFAARLEGTEPDLASVKRSTEKLLERYEKVLIEGAGGLMVPIRGFYTTLDYIEDHALPVILVTNPKLGSVNHTLLSLEACINRGIRVDMVLYNLYPETSPEITEDTRRFLGEWLHRNLPRTEFIEIPFTPLL